MIGRIPQGPAVADGAAVDASALTLVWWDPAAQWGVGVFETLAVRSRTALRVAAHLTRLETAARRIGIALPAWSVLDAAARHVASGAERDGWLKIAVSRSGHWAVFAGALETFEDGRAVSAVVLTGRRHRLDPLVGIKTLAYAPAVLGLEEAHRRGADEGIWLNERGHVIGACTANLFALRGRAVVTPSLSDGARDGVTRARAIEALREAGLTVRESKVRYATLRAADEIFLTSSVRGVRPVVRLDGRDVRKGRLGSVTTALGERLAAEDVPRDTVSDAEERQR
ncbi:MAG TPA: aminotransferase class IV [Candidatus Polarisedimenticolaceae bacterium]|nr:aminotransferase class IV [Candidatus Polarisedimenticolaceae bacterium]